MCDLEGCRKYKKNNQANLQIQRLFGIMFSSPVSPKLVSN